jgi:hypothetical protein
MFAPMNPLTLRVLPGAAAMNPRAMEQALMAGGSDWPRHALPFPLFDELAHRLPPGCWIHVDPAALNSMPAPWSSLTVLERHGYLQIMEYAEFHLLSRPLTLAKWWSEVLTPDAYAIYQGITTVRGAMVSIARIGSWVEESYQQRPAVPGVDAIDEALALLVENHFASIRPRLNG